MELSLEGCITDAECLASRPCADVIRPAMLLLLKLRWPRLDGRGLHSTCARMHRLHANWFGARRQRSLEL